MSATSGVSQRLDDLAEYLRGRGLGEQMDFYITGRFPDQVPSSEHIGMRETDDGFRVWYRDMSVKKTLLETDDFEAARAVFVEAALDLGRQRRRKISKDRG